MRLDLVTHCCAPLLPPRPPLGGNARAACAPSVLPLFSAHPQAVGAIPVSEGSVETNRVVGQDDGGPGVASASPSCDKGRRRASSIATQAPPETTKINAFNRSRAARSTRGDSACVKPQHATRSNIHSGISRQRAAPSAVSAHRNVRGLPLLITSWTNTRRPNQGVPGIEYFPFFGPVGVMLLRCTTRSGPTPQSDTSHQHQRCSSPPSPRGRLRYADRLCRPLAQRPTLN
jgi:hypothetical protein